MNAAEILANFDETDGNGNVLTLVEFSQVELFSGRSVLVGDPEGRVCEATVVSVTDGVVVLDLGRGDCARCGADRSPAHSCPSAVS